MSRFFNTDGISIPVTIIEVTPNRVTQIKNKEQDGYYAIQVTTGIASSNSLNKPKLGHFERSGVKYGKKLWEFRLNKLNPTIFIGDCITIKLFEYIKKVDVTGISKGKGFSGTVKRWNFRTQDASHGNSLSHRAPGSIGQNQTPGRVFKGKKMAGQLGHCQVTIQNLDVINVDIENNFLLIKGAVPGIIGENVIIKKSVKVQ